MNRGIAIGGSVLGAAALLGAGVAVGTQVGAQQQAAVVVADAAAQVPQGFADPQEQLRLNAFVQSADEFQKLIRKATGDPSATDIGEQMIGYAVAVRSIKRTATTPELRDAADAMSQAMLFIGAGVIADEGGITQEGIDAYKAANEEVVALSNKVAADPAIVPQAPSPSAP